MREVAQLEKEIAVCNQVLTNVTEGLNEELCQIEIAEQQFVSKLRRSM